MAYTVLFLHFSQVVQILTSQDQSSDEKKTVRIYVDVFYLDKVRFKKNIMSSRRNYSVFSRRWRDDGLVGCISSDLKLFDLLNGLALGCYETSHKVLIMIMTNYYKC